MNKLAIYMFLFLTFYGCTNDEISNKCKLLRPTKEELENIISICQKRSNSQQDISICVIDVHAATCEKEWIISRHNEKKTAPFEIVKCSNSSFELQKKCIAEGWNGK